MYFGRVETEVGLSYARKKIKAQAKSLAAYAPARIFAESAVLHAQRTLTLMLEIAHFTVKLL